MHLMDVQTRSELARDRNAKLALAWDVLKPAAPATSRTPTRRRVGLWLIDVGQRLACDQPQPTRA